MLVKLASSVCSGTTFINGGSVFKVSRVIMWPRMFCNPSAFGSCFDISAEMLFFLMLKALSVSPGNVEMTTSNGHEEFCTRRLTANPAKVD